MRVRLAKNIGDPRTDKGKLWIHPKTHQQFGLGDLTIASITRILDMDLGAQALGGEEILDQIIGYELLQRGFIIPEHMSERKHYFQCNPTHLEDVGFFHLPTSYYDMLPEDSSVALLAVPTDMAGGPPGSRYGPVYLREASQKIGFRSSKTQEIYCIESQDSALKCSKIFDCGNLVVKELTSEEIRESLQNVIQTLAKKCIPFVIGGDHSLTFSIVAGIVGEFGESFEICQFDHHLDIQFSKFSKGVPQLEDYMAHGNFVSHILEQFPRLRFHHIGVSNFQSFAGVSPDEIRAYLAKLGTQTSDLELLLHPDCLQERIPQGKNIYITIDVDVFAHYVIPETGYPADFGISKKIFIKTLEKIIKYNNIIGIDFMEYGLNSESFHKPVHMFAAKILLKILQKVIKKQHAP